MKNPANRGQLGPADKKKLADWLSAKGCRCGSCGGTASGANAGYLFFKSGWDMSHPQDKPTLLLTCETCGCQSFYCPFTIGLAAADPED